jgi:FtsZ-interacting cell division protein ZipA
MAENGLPRFALQVETPEDEATHRVDLVLDVPNSLPDDQAFSRMVTVGRDLAARLDAHVLDDQGRTFQDSSSAAIDRQISGLYDQLDQAGFLAGTDRAARVFS